MIMLLLYGSCLVSRGPFYELPILMFAQLGSCLESSSCVKSSLSSILSGLLDPVACS